MIYSKSAWFTIWFTGQTGSIYSCSMPAKLSCEGELSIDIEFVLLTVTNKTTMTGRGYQLFWLPVSHFLQRLNEILSPAKSSKARLCFVATSSSPPSQSGTGRINCGTNVSTILWKGSTVQHVQKCKNSGNLEVGLTHRWSTDPPAY